MPCRDRFAALLIVPVMSAASGISYAGEAQANREPLAIGELARTLVDRGRTTPVLSKGRTKFEVGDNAERFPLSTGETPVALFALPAYSAPYRLTIRSVCKCLGFAKKILVPLAFVLDGEYRTVRSIAEDEFVVKDADRRAMISAHFAAAVSIDEQRKDWRYLLIFTRPAYFSPDAHAADSSASQGVVRDMGVRAAAIGSLELEGTPALSGKPTEVDFSGLWTMPPLTSESWKDRPHVLGLTLTVPAGASDEELARKARLLTRPNDVDVVNFVKTSPEAAGDNRIYYLSQAAAHPGEGRHEKETEHHDWLLGIGSNETTLCAKGTGGWHDCALPDSWCKGPASDGKTVTVSCKIPSHAAAEVVLGRVTVVRSSKR